MLRMWLKDACLNLGLKLAADGRGLRSKKYYWTPRLNKRKSRFNGAGGLILWFLGPKESKLFDSSGIPSSGAGDKSGVICSQDMYFLANQYLVIG